MHTLLFSLSVNLFNLSYLNSCFPVLIYLSTILISGSFLKFHLYQYFNYFISSLLMSLKLYNYFVLIFIFVFLDVPMFQYFITLKVKRSKKFLSFFPAFLFETSSKSGQFPFLILVIITPISFSVDYIPTLIFHSHPFVLSYDFTCPSY